jgi:hypothetical protein
LGLRRTAVLKYPSGGETKKGDHVLFHGNPAKIEFVASDANNLQPVRYIQEFGSGVMVLDPMVSGSTFISRDHIPEYEDLEFVSRRGAVNSPDFQFPVRTALVVK